MLWTARAATFTAAMSLFLLQPLVARALVPLYGGTSWVWIAVSVFFQLSLILGYLAATRLSVKDRSRRHARAAAPALALAVAGFWVLASRTTFDRLPAEAAVFVHLLLTVGAVAIYLAMASPLLQIAIESDARIDAHRLYAWSNAGSLIGLVVYPTLMESFVPLRWQMGIWITLAAAAAMLIHRTLTTTDASPAPQQVVWQFPGRWRVAFISGIASALTIAVTARLTLDMGGLPLLWVLPLIMLLLSYVVAFGNLRAAPVLAAAAPMAVVMACYVYLENRVEMSALEMVLLWCGLLFVIQCGLQTRLRTIAPTGAARGAYYVTLACGGFAGSLLIGCLIPYFWNTATLLAATPVTAPVLRPLLGINAVPELGWCLVAAAFALIGSERWRGRDVIASALLGAAVLLLMATDIRNLSGLPSAIAILPAALAIAHLPARVGRPSLYALAVMALIVVCSYLPQGYARELFRVRNVYGVLFARESMDGGFTELYHGTTLHGTQYSGRDASGEVVPRAPEEPLTYYHRGSAIGEAFNALATPGCPRRVGIIGLGAGSLAGYARAGDEFEFYEIDPAVIAAAEGEHFSFLAAARKRGARITIVEGDGRLTLARRVGPKLDLVVVDAFSSDAIPTHLLTLEAFETARRQLSPGASMMFHTSNRYYDVNRVVAANAAHLGWGHSVRGDKMRTLGTVGSTWVVVRPPAQSPPGPCFVDLMRESDPVVAARPVWSDDFSNPLALLRAQGVWRQLKEMR